MIGSKKLALYSGHKGKKPSPRKNTKKDKPLTPGSYLSPNPDPGLIFPPLPIEGKKILGSTLMRKTMKGFAQNSDSEGMEASSGKKKKKGTKRGKQPASSSAKDKLLTPWFLLATHPGPGHMQVVPPLSKDDCEDPSDGGDESITRKEFKCNQVSKYAEDTGPMGQKYVGYICPMEFPITQGYPKRDFTKETVPECLSSWDKYPGGRDTYKIDIRIGSRSFKASGVV